MANLRKRKRLLDAYRFPGFRPSEVVHGVFGDSVARVVALDEEVICCLLRNGQVLLAVFLLPSRSNAVIPETVQSLQPFAHGLSMPPAA